jgi:class 3 adenylate cyclase
MATPSDHPSDLAVYVPRLVREWVSEDPSPTSKHRSVEGSMVFADVSGFTKLSERLAKLG